VDIKITTGSQNYEIIGHGSILCFNDEDITFHLGTDLKCILSFQNDPKEPSSKLDFKVISKKELQIYLTNFNNSLGTGNAIPLPLANLNNKQAYLNFCVYSPNKANKLIHYTWYLREEVTDDKQSNQPPEE